MCRVGKKISVGGERNFDYVIRYGRRSTSVESEDAVL